MVVLFNLKTILKYKVKNKRDYEYVYKEFKKYQEFLKKLKNKKPSLILPDELLNKNVEILKGKDLKKYEDTLDAIFCAYIAYYYWYYPEKCEVLGNLKEGYIVTPIFDYIKNKLKSLYSQKSILDFF